MPGETLPGDLPDPDPDLDSNCTRCEDEVDEGDREEKSNAVTYVQASDGGRRYLCREHAEQEVLRFDTTPELHSALADAPVAERCRACGLVTARSDLDPATKKCLDCQA